MSGLTDFQLLGQPAPNCKPPAIHFKPLTCRCSECRVNGLCLPRGLAMHCNSYFGTLIGPRTRVRKGAALFNANVPLSSLYAVHSGSFKTNLNNAEGQGVIINFWMPGDVMGLDAIATELHVCDAIALEDSEVCPLHFSQLERLASKIPSLQHNLNKVMSR